MSRVTFEISPRERGVVFVEAAVVFGVLMLLVLGFIDFARMMALESQLTVAAEQALTVASTDPGIDSYDFTKGPGNQPVDGDFDRAEKRVIAKAKEIAYAKGINPEQAPIESSSLGIPRTAPRAGVTMEQVLETTPIEINLSAQYDPILPFLSATTVRGRAVGYREPRKMANQPLVVDCNGNVLGSTNYEKQPCPCPVDKMWDFAAKKCVCRNNPLNDGSCGCPPEKRLSSDYSTCECRENNCSSRPNTTQNKSTCACDCQLTGGFNSDTCTCKSGFIQTGLSCGCPTSTSGLPANTTYNPLANCELTCRSGFVANSGGVSSGCSCPPNRIESSGACVCDHSTCFATDGVNNARRTGANCDSCTCGSYATRVGDTCQCPSSEYMMSSGNCVCSNTACPNLGQTRMPQGAGCGCFCDTSRGFNSTPSGGQCECSDPNKQRSGTSCVCRSAPVTTTCTYKQLWNTSSCKCECKASRGGANCDCNGNMTDPDNDGVCTCPNTAPQGGWVNQPDCSLGCPSGLVLFQNRCVRPECAVSRCTEFTVGDGTCSGCPEI